MTKELGTRRQGRQKVPLEEARAIRDRLWQHVQERYPSRAAFADLIAVPRTTVTGWFSPRPRTPETPHLLRLARTAKLNLNWLLLGEGTEVLPELVPWDNLALQLRNRMVAELRARYQLSDSEIQLVVPPDPAKALDDVLERYALLVELMKYIYDRHIKTLLDRPDNQPTRSTSAPKTSEPPEEESELLRRFDEVRGRMYPSPG